jgi:hypothetical protein
LCGQLHVARSDFQAINRIDGWQPCRHVIVSYYMICDGETGVLNYAVPGNYCPAVSSGAGIWWKALRSEQDGSLRDCLPNMCALLGSRTPWDSILRVCDNRQLTHTDIRNASAILSWLLQLPTMLASRANFTL